MPSTILPPWPHFVFAVFEPLSLIGGWLLPILNLQSFITDQIPNYPHPPPLTPGTTSSSSIHPTSTALAYQLANLYGLLCLLGLGIINATTEPRVLRNYFIALAIADVGHIYVTYLAMGWETFVDVKGWNVLTWGNVGATGFLLVNRVLYLLGVLGGVGSGGSDSGGVKGKKKRV